MTEHPLPEYPRLTWEDERVGQPVNPPVPSSAWMDPLGKFFPVPDCGHARWAEENFGTWGLEERGWVHISFGNMYYDKYRLRQSQIDALYDVLEVYRSYGYYVPEFEKSYYGLLDVFNTVNGD